MEMRITGTFLDEITFDIPHNNWGYQEWDNDFAAMRAMGIRRVIMIRCANGYWMAYPSEVIPRFGLRHRPPVDLMDMFLELAERRKHWKAPVKVLSGFLARYSRNATDADTGGVLK